MDSNYLSGLLGEHARLQITSSWVRAPGGAKNSIEFFCRESLSAAVPITLCLGDYVKSVGPAPDHSPVDLSYREWENIYRVAIRPVYTGL